MVYIHFVGPVWGGLNTVFPKELEDRKQEFIIPVAEFAEIGEHEELFERVLCRILNRIICHKGLY